MRRCIVLEQHYLQRRIKLSVFFWKYSLNSKFTNFNSTSSMISVTVTNRFNTAPKVILVTSVGVIPTITSVSRVY